jgi:hypothetical protein
LQNIRRHCCALVMTLFINNILTSYRNNGDVSKSEVT